MKDRYSRLAFHCFFEVKQSSKRSHNLAFVWISFLLLLTTPVFPQVPVANQDLEFVSEPPTEFIELLTDFDSNLARAETELALVKYRQIEVYGMEGAQWTLSLLQTKQFNSELTIKAICNLIGATHSTLFSSAALQQIFLMELDDWTVTKCIDELGPYANHSISDAFLLLAEGRSRDVNLRIAALREFHRLDSAASIPKLLPLLHYQDEQPVFRHKVVQYLSAYDDPTITNALLDFLLDGPDDVHASINKEFVLLVLKDRIGGDLVPVLQEILSNTRYRDDVKGRTIEVLSSPEMTGASTILGAFIKEGPNPELASLAQVALEDVLKRDKEDE